MKVNEKSNEKNKIFVKFLTRINEYFKAGHGFEVECCFVK